MNKYFKIISIASCSLALNGCVSPSGLFASPSKAIDPYTVQQSYLEKEQGEVVKGKQANGSSTLDQKTQTSRVQNLSPLKISQYIRSDVSDPSESFSDTNEVKVAVDNLQLKDFLHYVLGDLLNVSYVLSESAKEDSQAVTLNIQQQISSRRLFSLVEDVLEQRSYSLVKKDDVFYVLSAEESSGTALTVFGVGREVEDVPNTSKNIYQIVPFKYGFNPGLQQVLRQVAGVTHAAPDGAQGVYYLLGKRVNILQAIEFIKMIDRPNDVSQNVSYVQLNYINTDEFVDKVQTLLANDGITVGQGKAGGANIVIVPLEQRNALVVFAKQAGFTDRLEYWAKKLDQPSQSDDEDYFIYTPKFARAIDLEESISPLMGNILSQSSAQGSTAGKANQRSRTNTKSSTGKSKSTGTTGSSNLVVDERSNVLIFYTTGKKYQNLLPLLKKLDVQPKQVLLEVTIAEVTLKDDYKQGVEFALTKGKYALSTKGAMGLDAIGGLSYSLTGADGSLAVSLFQDNSHVNVLSRPSLVVRDGVTASISVGTDIPVVGQTTTDPISGDRQTTSIQYRKTGVQLSVTPTVNSQGVVIMQISQDISNTVDGGVSTGGSPSIFERTIDTEVVADSGQTIILGGLISENKTRSSTQVPFFGDIPIFGHLFRSEGDLKDKTELVVLVTPKIIHRNDEWADLKQKFYQNMSNINIDDVQ